MSRKFVYGVAVNDYNFTGRQQETQRLIKDFKGGINVILMSPRRMGKTSLVKHVCRQLEGSDIITIYVDIFGCKNEYEFYNSLAEAVLQQTASQKDLWLEEAKNFIYRLTPKISFSPDPTSAFSLSLGITPETHKPEEILSLAEQIAKKKGKRIVVCIDEFQQIGEMADSRQIQARLRSVWQHQEMVSYCLFGSKHHLMSSVFLDSSMPFYQFGDLVQLDKIPTKEWVDYIVSHFADGKRNISNRQAEEICRLTDNYSAYVQQLSWLVYTQLSEGETVTDEHISTAMDDLLTANEILFIQLTDPLSEYQRNFLRAIASGVTSDFGMANIRETYQLGSYSNVTRLKKALIERDLIMGTSTCLTFTDPVFEQWFRRRMM